MLGENIIISGHGSANVIGDSCQEVGITDKMYGA